MNFRSGAFGSGSGGGVMSEEEEQTPEEEEDEEQPGGNGRTPAGGISTLAQHSLPAVAAQTQSTALVDWTRNTEGETEIPKGARQQQLWRSVKTFEGHTANTVLLPLLRNCDGCF